MRTSHLVGVLWHQGEGDAFEETEEIPASKRGEIYYSDLMATVTDIREKVNDPSLPFIAGEYSPEWYLTIPKVCDAILDGSDLKAKEETAKHAEWVASFKDNYGFTQENVDAIVKDEVGKVFAKVLEHAGVYKRDEKGIAAFEKFINTLA